jgi:hypothetical protein
MSSDSLLDRLVSADFRFSPRTRCAQVWPYLRDWPAAIRRAVLPEGSRRDFRGRARACKC